MGTQPTHLKLRFRYFGQFQCDIAVFIRFFVRFCGFRTPLTPPSMTHHSTESLRVVLSCGTVYYPGQYGLNF